MSFCLNKTQLAVVVFFSAKQQAKMANYCQTVFGDMLLSKPLDEFPVNFRRYVDLKSGLNEVSTARFINSLS